METSSIVIIVTGLGIAIVLAVIAEFILKVRERHRVARAEGGNPCEAEEREELLEDETTSSCASQTTVDWQPWRTGVRPNANRQLV